MFISENDELNEVSSSRRSISSKNKKPTVHVVSNYYIFFVLTILIFLHAFFQMFTFISYKQWLNVYDDDGNLITKKKVIVGSNNSASPKNNRNNKKRFNKRSISLLKI